MQGSTQANEVEAEDKARTFKQVLEAQSNEHGEIEDGDRMEIGVTYENRKGNTSLKTGEVWRVSDDRINFSQNAGGRDEDAYYIDFKSWKVQIVSVSDRGSHTELGEITNIVFEG